jgi:type IV pilus assembly protein PilV
MKRTINQTGFSLIEVLVTLLVLTVALLSAASLQVLSKRSNFDAAQRTSAAHLAEDFLERLRSNASSSINYVPAGTLGGGTLGAAPPVNCLNPVVTCTALQMAQFDLWQWEQQLDGVMESDNGRATGGLVSPTACITGPGFGGNGEYTVAIAWRGMTDLANPVVNTCGEASGNYGAGNEYRRIIQIRTFINVT